MQFSDSQNIVLILSVGFTLASFMGYVAQRLKLSPIIGYLLAGYMIGPFSPFFVADLKAAEQLAEIGVVLMMFGVGLHFKWGDLLLVKHIAITGAIGQSAVATIVGFFLTYSLGWSLEASIITGVSISVASTVVLVRVLNDNHLLETKQGHIAVGWLIVEDVFTVAALVFLPTFAAFMAGKEISAINIVSSMIAIVLKFVILAGVMLTLGSHFVSIAMHRVARLRSQELFTLAILSAIFAIAVGSAALFGTSIALGAFIAGMVMGKTHVHQQASASALPLQSAFIVLFFISVGMLLNPFAIRDHFALFTGILAITILIKPLSAFLIALFFRQSILSSLTVALSLAQIGEFSFILAQEALKLKLLPDEGYDLLVAVALISISLNPLFFQVLNKYKDKLRQLDIPLPEKITLEEGPRAIVVGYGLTGQKACELLAEQGFSILVIEHNIDSILKIKKNCEPYKVQALYGDAAQHGILEHAHVGSAQLLVIAGADLPSTIAIIQQARVLKPTLNILARVNYETEKETLQALDVEVICNEREAIKAFEHTLMNVAQGC